MSSSCERSVEALKALERARAALVLSHPFFGSLALRLRPVCDESCPGLWVDGRTLGCNPAYACAASDKALLSALAHEVLHVALGHHVRRAGRDERLWNRACDYAVNHLLLESGFSLPEGALYRPEYADRSADEIYGWLAVLQDGESHRAHVLSEEGEESAFVEGDGGSDGLGGEQGVENEASSAAPKSGEEVKGALQERGGSASDRKQGRERDAERNDCGEVRDHPLLRDGRGDAAREKAEQEADMALTQAFQEALRMGDMPAGLARFVRSRLYPSMDWREQLSRFIELCSDNDYSWSQPDRRYVHAGLYLPSRREMRLPPVALAVDASGSVDAALLSRFCTELSGILEAFDTTLLVFWHDMTVTGRAVYERQDLPVTPLPSGGGGTDYRPVAEALEETGVTPACLLWFTDMECDRFPEQMPCPVLWVCPSEPKIRPPFGEVLIMPEHSVV